MEIEIPKEAVWLWKEHPVTQLLFKELQGLKSHLLELKITKGTIEETALNCARCEGEINIINKILDVEGVEYATED